MSRTHIISLVERGWQSARVLSIALVTQTECHVTHYLKGRVAPEALAMITPYQRMRIHSIPRWAFRLAAGGVLLGGALRGTLRLVVVDHVRTRQQVRWFLRWWGIPVIEAEIVQQLRYRWDGEHCDVHEVLQRVTHAVSTPV